MGIIWEPRLDPAARQWLARAREIGRTQFAARAAQIDRDQRYPAENVATLYETGIATMFLPTRYGGGGANLTALCAVIEELAQACPSTSGIVATVQLGSTPLMGAGSEALRERVLGAIAGRREAISFALSEGNSSSDPAGMQTLATPERGGWRIRGEKRWIGGGSQCARYVVFAQTQPGSGRKGIAAFVVEANADGVRDDKIEDKMGMRGTVNATVEFDTWVGADAMVAEPGRALKLALEALNVGRIVVAAQASGIALAAFEAAGARAASRQAFGTTIINHQGVGFQLADLATRISASRMLTYEAALGYDSGADIAALGAQAKLFASETAHDAVDVGVQVFGGEGYVKPALVERLYRDQRATEIYEGTSEIQRLVLARAIGRQFATAGGTA